MSYADAASKGPKQTPEDTLLSKSARQTDHTSRAPRVGGVYKDESEGATSLIDVDTPHVTSVESSFLSQEIKTSTQADRLEREEEELQKAREEARKAGRGKDRRSSLRRNSGNPVIVGNALLITLLGAGLGIGAYQKHTSGQLSWQLVGVCSGIVGAVGVVDYFASKWLFQNKYPPK